MEHGKSGFYHGWIADEIIDVITNAGGLMSHDDLTAHESTLVDPISTSYRGVEIYEIPPNGQGITALLALNLLEGFDISSLDPSSSEYYHLMIECLRLAFADSRYYVADIDYYPIPIKKLLSKSYATSRRALIDKERAYDKPNSRVSAKPF